MFSFSRFIGYAAVAALVSFAGSLTAQATNVEGQLDTHFNQTGKQLVAFYSYDGNQAVAVTVLPNGKTLVAGNAGNGDGTYDVALTRLNNDGTLDTSFGDSGKALFSFGGAAAIVSAMAVQPDGKIVVAGQYEANASNNRQFFAMRLNADATQRDNSFGNGAGYQLVDFNSGDDAAESIALAPDGSIFLAGYMHATDNVRYLDFAVAKLQANGMPDNSFNGSGKFSVGFDQGGDNYDRGRAIALQSDGKVVVVGRVRSGPSASEFGVLRLNANGAPDYSFGNLASGGFNFHPGQSIFQIASHCSSEVATTLQIYEGDYIGGPFRLLYVAGDTCYLSTTTAAVVVSVKDDGTLDTSFGNSNGLELVDLNPDYDAQHVSSLLLQPPPKTSPHIFPAPQLLVIGSGHSKQYHNNDMLMTRLSLDGNVDTQFGAGGHQSVYFNYAGGVGDDYAKGAAMVSNGYLVVVGSSQRSATASNTDFAVTRLLVGDGIFHDDFELPQ